DEDRERREPGLRLRARILEAVELPVDRLVGAGLRGGDLRGRLLVRRIDERRPPLGDRERRRDLAHRRCLDRDLRRTAQLDDRRPDEQLVAGGDQGRDDDLLVIDERAVGGVEILEYGSAGLRADSSVAARRLAVSQGQPRRGIATDLYRASEPRRPSGVRALDAL